MNAVKHADVRDFIADQLDRWKPATALNRYRSLQAFFKWCIAEGELKTSPMVGMKPPQLPDQPPPMLTDDQLRRLLKSCDGRGFTDRRDTAIIRLFIDTGVRVLEAAGILLPDDLDSRLVIHARVVRVCSNTCVKRVTAAFLVALSVLGMVLWIAYMAQRWKQRQPPLPRATTIKARQERRWQLLAELYRLTGGSTKKSVRKSDLRRLLRWSNDELNDVGAF